MEFFLVGGAVRDRLMGRPVNDYDYVVVGATPQQMVNDGFEVVGAEFPVFLKNGVEYALARTERSTGKGYHDFETQFDPTATLEQDLERRDLTVNAMAVDNYGAVVDPFGGRNDLADKVLRHVSNSFADDPVRVLRLARFRAQFGEAWTVADKTVELCRKMAADGMLDHLTGERVGKELFKALASPSPRLFFDTLDLCGALEHVFPVVHKMKTVEEHPKYHPEGNTYEHTMLVLTAARKLTDDPVVMFSALTHDFGKTLTDPAEYPRHLMHEVRGVKLVDQFADQVRVDRQVKKTAKLVCRYHMHMHKLDEMKPTTYVKMFDALGAWNNGDVVRVLFQVGVADMRGKLGNERADSALRRKLVDAFETANAVRFAHVTAGKDATNWSGERIKTEMFNARARALKGVV